MKILFIVKKNMGTSKLRVIGNSVRSSSAKIIYLDEVVDYEKLVKDMFDCDRVVCW